MVRLRKGRWSKRRLNLVLLTIFGVSFITFALIPADTYGAWFIGESGAGTGSLPMSLKIGNEPRMIFNLSVKLTSVGGLSAGKDIYMQVHVTVISPEGWNNTYCCLAIVPIKALTIPPPLYLSPTPPITSPSALPFTLRYLGDGHYVTDGHFYVTQPTPIWVGFGNPKWNQTQVYDAIRTQLIPVANVTGTQSDALSVNLNEIAIKDSFVFGTFGFAALQPILVGLFSERRETG